MQVYHLTIHENGHSRRFVYEDRDEALTRLADAIAAGLDAKLDEVVRAPALSRSRPRATSGRAGTWNAPSEHGWTRSSNAVGGAAGEPPRPSAFVCRN